MDVVFTHGAGLDVHKQTVTACRVTPDPSGQQADGILELRVFGTMTADLLALSDWLFSGLLARYTNVKLAFSESQIGWMPYLFERADRIWRMGNKEESRMWPWRAPASTGAPCITFEKATSRSFWSMRRM